MEEENKTYFYPGQLVTLRQDLENKPVMIVDGKSNTLFRNGDSKSSLRGIKCRWFTKDGHLEEAIFNTKDLKLYERE